MTLGSPSAPTNPERHEARDIAAYQRLVSALLPLDRRVLLARIDWASFFSSAHPNGAVTPSLAKATLTRAAQRRWAKIRHDRRSQPPALRLLAAMSK